MSCPTFCPAESIAIEELSGELQILFDVDLVYRPWSLECDRIENRDMVGKLPLVQVGLVWRRGASMPDETRAFLSAAQSYHSLKQR